MEIILNLGNTDFPRFKYERKQDKFLTKADYFLAIFITIYYNKLEKISKRNNCIIHLDDKSGRELFIVAEGTNSELAAHCEILRQKDRILTEL